jgi:hypothetical protein
LSYDRKTEQVDRYSLIEIRICGSEISIREFAAADVCWEGVNASPWDDRGLKLQKDPVGKLEQAEKEATRKAGLEPTTLTPRLVLLLRSLPERSEA